MSLSRTELWIEFIQRHRTRHMAEIGVWRGEFAEALLRQCPSIERYYMIDPWRTLANWNKPFNLPQREFDEVFSEAMDRTAFAKDRRIVLRGRTTEVIEDIPDASLDLAYIDGDHTLRGISIDLQRCYSKLSAVGSLAGDDFTPSIWQHSADHEPSFVFPFAVYFAEAFDHPITALPHSQFLIDKGGDKFSLIDHTGLFSNTSILHQLKPTRSRARTLLSRMGLC